MGLLWCWWVFGALCAYGAALDEPGDPPRVWRTAGAWLARHGAERALAFAVGAVGLVWLGLTLRFYAGSPLPAALRGVAMAATAVCGAWGGAALLLSQSVAAVSERRGVGLWKASLLLPLAFPGRSLQALLVVGVAAGLPWGYLGVTRPVARILFAPVLLTPLFTLAFLAAYLNALVRDLLDRADGKPSGPDTTWREIWNPWK